MPKVIQVIESREVRGDGKDVVLRAVTQYHTLEGEFLAEYDPCPQESQKLRVALQGLVDALAANDEDGLTEFAEPMTAARAALK